MPDLTPPNPRDLVPTPNQEMMEDIYNVLVELQCLEVIHLQRCRGLRKEYQNLPPMANTKSPPKSLKSVIFESCHGIGQWVMALISHNIKLAKLKASIDHPMDIEPLYRLAAGLHDLKELYVAIYPFAGSKVGPMIYEIEDWGVDPIERFSEFDPSWKWPDLLANHKTLEYLSVVTGDTWELPIGSEPTSFPGAYRKNGISQAATELLGLKEIFLKASFINNVGHKSASYQGTQLCRYAHSSYPNHIP